MLSYVKMLLGFKLGAKVAMAAIVVGGVAASPYRLVVVRGGSMTPAYANSSVHWTIDRVGPLYRGEVVVVNSPVGTVIKRIQYLPGDWITEVKISGDWQVMVGVNHRPMHTKYCDIRRVQIPPGEIFIVGDESVRSIDSRDFGPVPEENVVGVLLNQRPKVLSSYEVKSDA